MIKGETYLGVAVVLLLVIVLVFAGSFNDNVNLTGNVVGDNVTETNETETNETEVVINETETNETEVVINETETNETETNETEESSTITGNTVEEEDEEEEEETEDTTEDTTEEPTVITPTPPAVNEVVEKPVTDDVKETQEPGITGGVVSEENTTECLGCLYEEKCFEINNSKKNKYCLEYETWVNQSILEEICTYDFECESNNCIDEECARFDILKEILEFLKELFTNEQKIVENITEQEIAENAS